MCEDNCESDNMMRRIYLYMDALNHYMIQFTNDISTGKRIWKTIEDTIKNKLENPQQNLTRLLPHKTGSNIVH